MVRGGIAGELRCREAVGTARCQLVEHLPEGMLTHGQCAPLGLMPSLLLGGWFLGISQCGKAFISFFPTPLSVQLYPSNFPPDLHIFLQLLRGGSQSPGRGVQIRMRVLCCSSPWAEPLLTAAVARVKSSSLFSSIQVTLISAFVFPQLPPKPVNVFFAFCISLCCISAGILVSTTTFAVLLMALSKICFTWCCLPFYTLPEKLSCLRNTS